MNICNWLILLVIGIMVWCTYDHAGGKWVKMKRFQESLKERQKRNKRPSGRRNWRQRYVIEWDHREGNCYSLYIYSLHLCKSSWKEGCYENHLNSVIVIRYYPIYISNVIIIENYYYYLSFLYRRDLAYILFNFIIMVIETMSLLMIIINMLYQ